ncbi:hypothetical protein J4453_03130 [Candidatus Woesearchaeota archaeon]|nr:hypothetical protein [Candidatus Woesearchaeota archaeon]
MNFEPNKSAEKTGEIAGYTVSYFLFTTILFYILFFLKKMPETWSYFHIMEITAIIAVIGLLVKRLLK